MGCFDSVFFDCPACESKSSVEAQSKASICQMREFHCSSVPPDVAYDIGGETVRCNECDEEYQIKYLGPARVACSLRPIPEPEEDREWD